MLGTPTVEVRASHPNGKHRGSQAQKNFGVPGRPGRDEERAHPVPALPSSSPARRHGAGALPPPPYPCARWNQEAVQGTLCFLFFPGWAWDCSVAISSVRKQPPESEFMKISPVIFNLLRAAQSAGQRREGRGGGTEKG